MTKTYSTRKAEIKRDWHLINLEDKVLGRVATEITGLLIGKNKAYFAPNLDCGDYVVVTNCAKLVLTGKKSKQKMYYRHSGYPGGFKEIPFARQMEKDPTIIVKSAVSRMLPKNKLRDGRLVRLKLFVGEDHPYGDKLKSQNSKLKATS